MDICVNTIIKYICVLQVQAYKEDFEQERKDRENAHRIKEEEIMKVRIKMEELVANHQMELKRMQDYYKDQTLQKVSLPQ